MGFVVHLASLWPHTSRMHRDKAEPASTATTFVPPASILDAHGNCINDNNSLLKRCPRLDLSFLSIKLDIEYPSFKLSNEIFLSSAHQKSVLILSKIIFPATWKPRLEAQSFNLSRIPRSFSFLFRQHVAFNWYVSKEGQRGNGKQKYPRGWRPLSRFNEACSCRRWSGAVSSDKVPTCSTRGPTLLQRDIRENCLALLLLLLLRFLLPPTESRQRQHPANIPSNRYESGLPNLRLVARKARRYNDFRRELCVATFQLFVSFLVSSFAYVEFVSVFTSETRLSSKFWIDRYNFSFLLNVFLHNEKKLYSFFNDS